MQKIIVAAAVLLLLQLGLVAAFNSSKKTIEGTAPQLAFVDFEMDKVTGLELSSGEGSSIQLRLVGDLWKIVNYYGAPAVTSQVVGLLDKLHGCRQGFVVSNSASGAERFKVAKDSFNSHLVLTGAEGKMLADIYVGTSPGFRQVHVRKAGQDNITVIGLNSYDLEADFDRWLDKNSAQFDEDQLAAIELNGFTVSRVAKAEPEKAEDKGSSGENKKAAQVEKIWQLDGLGSDEKLNSEELDELVAKVRDMLVTSVVDPAKASPLFETSPYLHYVVKKQDGSQVDCIFVKQAPEAAQEPAESGSAAADEADGAEYILKRSDNPLYFKVHKLSVESLHDFSRDRLLVKPEEPALPPTVAAPEAPVAVAPPVSEPETSAVTDDQLPPPGQPEVAAAVENANQEPSLAEVPAVPEEKAALVPESAEDVPSAAPAEEPVPQQ